MAELREPEACGTPPSGLPRVQRAGNSVHHPTCSTVPFYSRDHSLWDDAIHILPSTPWHPHPGWVFLFGTPTTYPKMCLLGKSKSRHVDSGNEPHTYHHHQVRTQQDQWTTGPSWHQAWFILTSRVNPVLKHVTANTLLKQMEVFFHIEEMLQTKLSEGLSNRPKHGRHGTSRPCSPCFALPVKPLDSLS